MIFHNSPPSLNPVAVLVDNCSNTGQRPDLQEQIEPESGQGLTEYALMLMLVSVVVVSIMSLLGPRVNTVFQQVNCGVAGFPQNSGPISIVSVSRLDDDTIRMRFSLSESAEVTFYDTRSAFHETFNLGPGTYNWITDDEGGSGHGETGEGVLAAHTAEGNLVCGRYQ